MKSLYKNITVTMPVLLFVLIMCCGCGTEVLTDTRSAQSLAMEQSGKVSKELERTKKASIYDNEIDLNQYYGGMYINDERKLTICCTTDDNQIADLFREAADSSDVIIKHVKFTYDELKGLKDEFHELVKAYLLDDELNEESKSLVRDLSGWGVDVFTNRLDIGIDGLDSDKEELFYELFDIFPIDSVRLENRGKPIPLTGEE